MCAPFVHVQVRRVRYMEDTLLIPVELMKSCESYCVKHQRKITRGCIWIYLWTTSHRTRDSSVMLTAAYSIVKISPFQILIQKGVGAEGILFSDGPWLQWLCNRPEKKVFDSGLFSWRLVRWREPRPEIASYVGILIRIVWEDRVVVTTNLRFRAIFL